MNPSTDEINRVLAALRASQGQLTEGEAAALIFRSRRTLRKLIRASFGVGFRAVRLRIKMECAQKFLRETPMPISTIGDRLGYASRYEMERSFKQYFGLTPTQYRATHVPVRPDTPQKTATHAIDSLGQHLVVSATRSANPTRNR